MKFWILVVLLGLEGAAADVSLSKWDTSSAKWWVITSFLWFVFMTGFGWSMELGKARGYSLTIAVVLVLLADIAAVAIWDVASVKSHFTPVQWLGAILAVSAILCLELGKKAV